MVPSKTFTNIFLRLKTFSFVVGNNMFGQELGLYKAQTKLPFNAFGTMAMARDVRIYSLTSVFFKHANHFCFYLLLFMLLNRNLRTTLALAKYFGY